MANPFQKLPAGSLVTAFSITAWNRFLDMLNWWETSQGGGGPSKKIVDWDQTVFRVKNTTGYALASYDPVGISGPIFTPTDADSVAELKNQTSMLGVEPTVADHAGGKWGVMLEAAADDKIGRCCLSGVVPVRVFVTAFADTAVDVIAAETVGDETVYLGSGATGAKILWWAATGAGDNGTIVWAIVRLGNNKSPQLYGKLDADLDGEGGTPGTLSVWNATADTNENISVYPPFSGFFGNTPAGTKVGAEWDDVSQRFVLAGGVGRYRGFNWYMTDQSATILDSSHITSYTADARYDEAGDQLTYVPNSPAMFWWNGGTQVTIKEPCVFAFGFQCRAYRVTPLGADADVGDVIIKAYLNTTATTWQAYGQGGRVKDAYGTKLFVLKDNIAFSGYLQANTNDVFKFYNVSGNAIQVDKVQFWVRMLARYNFP